MPFDLRPDDLDKDGRVSREEFIDMRNAIRLFLKDAKCQEILIEVLAGLVAAHWKVRNHSQKGVGLCYGSLRLQA